MPTRSSRRRPWPWDIRLGTRQPGGTAVSKLIGMMLIPQQDGLLVGRKQTNLNNAVPPQMDYGSAPVYKEHTFEFRPSGGMGESVQSSRTDRRYHFAMDCWVTGGLFGLGPLFHPKTTPGVTGRVRRFIEAAPGTYDQPNQLYYLAGDAVYVRQASDDPTLLHRRAGHIATDAAHFVGGYSGALECLYVAWDDGVLEEFNGSAWATCALPSGFLPNLLCVVGHELWAAHGQAGVIRKVEADPKVNTNWDGPILVGDTSSTITALRQTSNVLTIFKSDGKIYTINADGSDNDLFPGLTTTNDLDNARTAVAWQGSLWFRIDRAFWRLEFPGAVLTPTGPGRQLGNLSEVRGPVQAFAGWNSQMAFGGIFNASKNTSYLLTFGNWQPQQGDSGTEFNFTSQWDGAIAHWVGRKITALWVSNIPTDARLYVGFEDGNYDWCKLVAYPLIPNSGGEFVSSGYIVAPLHHDMFQADTKQTIGMSVFGPSFPLQTSVDISYRLRAAAGMPPSDPTGAFLPVGSEYTQNGQRQDVASPVAGVGLEMMVTLNSTSTAQTPVLEGIGLHERLVPKFRRDFSLTIDAKSVVARRDGATMRQSGRQIRDLVMQASAAPSTVSLELPEETLFDVAMFDYVERVTPHNIRGGQGWAIDVQATQFGVTEIYGTIGRTRGNTIGSLRGWQIQQLRYF